MIAVIILLVFAYFTRIDGYHERIEQFSSYLPIDKQILLNLEHNYQHRQSHKYNLLLLNHPVLLNQIEL